MTHGKDKPLSTHPLPTDLLSADHRRRPGRGRIAQVAVTVSAMVAATVVAPVAATVVTAAPATAAGTDVHLIVVDADAFGGQGGLIGFNAANGAAATLWQSPYGGNSYGVAVDRDGTLLVVDRDAFPGGPGGVIRVNQVTGTATPITSDRYLSNPTGIVVAPDGAIFVVDADARASLTGDSGVGGVIKVNPTTGEQTLVSSGGVFGNPTGIAVEPCSGVGCPNGYDLLVADMSSFGGDGGVIRVNPANGAQTELASNGDFGDPTGLVVAPSGDVYVVDQNWDSGDGGVIKLPAGSIQPGDPVVHPTVSGNEVSGHDEWGNPTGITLGSDGMLYVADPDKAGANGDDGAIFRVDPATKAVTQLARTGGAPGLFQGPVGLAVAPATPPAAPPVPQGPYAPKTFTQPAAGAANCTLSTYTVPPGVTQLGFTVTAEAGKAGEGIIGGHLGGVGGFADTATGVLAVTPGEVLYANVARNGSGGQGRDYGGFGGDLAFLSTDSQSGIPIDLGGCAAASFLVVAGGGGGGGAADSTYGGNGGGAGTPVASNGRSGDSGNLPTYEPGRGGGGASLAAGGAAAPGGSNSLAGAAQRGGSGAQGDWHGDGGGGGGGYYGGGGGGGGSGTADLYAGGGGGGGGSTYFGPTVSDGAAYWAPTRATTPSVTLTPLGVTSSLSLAANPASATVGASVVLTATISPAPSSSPLPADPGTVTFTVDGTTIGTAAVDAATGVATLSTAFSSTGTKQITATYTGNGFLSSSTGSTTITVTNNPPAWISPTPAEGAVIDATPGSPVTIVVKAGDPDAGDIVTLTVPSGAPTGSSWSTSGSNPATGTLTVTPSAAGQLTIGFGAYDGSSLHAADRHVTLAVTQKSPTISWDTPAAITYGTALGADQLDAALSTAQGALTPPHAGTFTYTPAAGTVPHAGDNTLSVTWNPDTADAAAWSAVTAMVTLHVNQAPQTLLFSPAISDSTTYSYGDPPFTVTAVSDAGLAVTYSVGTGDACTSTPSGGSTTITITGVGPCTLSVDQPGDADHTAAATLQHSFTIAKKTPTLTLTPADTVYGTPLGSGQLDATINPADAAGHGAITYTVDGAAIPDGGILPAGSHTLTATYAPDADSNYNTASAGATFTVAKADQSVTFDALGDKTFGDAQFTVAATSSAGLTITFTTPTTDVCAVTTAGTVSLLHAGTCTVSAEQAGDDNHNAATSVTQSFTVGKAAQAITFTSPNNATYLDAALTLSATGGASGNPVTFTAGPVDVCTVTGSTLTLTGAGDCTITAHQDGNADYLAAAPVGHTITIAKATPTVSWSTPGQISYGTPLGAAQLDATVTPAIAGTFGYTLADGTTDADGAVLHASATPQTLHVTFTPTDAADYTSATGQTQITVVKADQAITWSSVPTDKTYGDAPFDVSAVGGGSGNPVTFTVQSGSTCTVSGTTVTITGAGACVLAADQAGNDDYNPATTSTQSLTVAKQTPTITWATPPDIVYGTALSAAQLNATVAPGGAADNGTLAYTTDAASGAAAGQVLHAGTHSLTATYTPGSSGAGPDYTGATATVALTVTQATQAITGFTLSDGTFGDGPITLSATGGDSDNPVTFTVQTGSTCEIGGDGVTLTFTGAGSCTVTAHQAGNADYLDAPGVTQTITLAKAPQEIAFAQPADSHVADPTITLTATGGGSGNSVTFTGGPLATCSSTATGILTITGPGTCTVTASQLGNGNYLDATPVARSFTVSYRICDLTPTNQWGVLLGVLQIQVTTCDAAGHSLASRSIVVHATGVDGGPAIPVGFFQRGNNFRYIGWHGGSYVYNLWVGDLADGTHTMTFTVAGDPTEHSIDFTLNGGCLSIWRLLF